MASPEKRCLYEVLGLRQDCTPDEIRSAYKKLALQRHPDKLVQSGLSQADATASFQELVNAYEVLSDPRERAWYDSHRSQILFANPDSSKGSSAIVPDLFSFFSNSVFSGYSDAGKGFYKVYADVFDKIYRNELNFAKKLGLGPVKEAPLMGNLESPYAQVNAFYGYWLGFVTVMDFVWADEYDAMAGPNRKSRRVMEEENKKIRKKARREYNETVRGLAEFVKKRDKRVIDMQVKRSEEMERKRKEERERTKKLEREKAERARAYEDPEWAKVEDDDDGESEEEPLEEEAERKKEFYCVVCGKKFKSEQQWKNHEQSKKHKEKLSELRDAVTDEASEEEEVLDDEPNGNGISSGSNEVDELKEKFKRIGRFHEDKHSVDGESHSGGNEGIFHNFNAGGTEGVAKELGLDDGGGDDDEITSLEAMLPGESSKKSTHKHKNLSKKVRGEEEAEEIDLMEYNNRKGRRNRRVGKESNKRVVGGGTVEMAEVGGETVRDGTRDISSQAEKLSSHHSPAIESDGQSGKDRSGTIRVSKQAVGRKETTDKGTGAKANSTPKGRKQKATSRTASLECETCGKDFESRNKLHKHLSDSGHAALKSR